MNDESKRWQSSRLALALALGASLMMVACGDDGNGSGGNGGNGGSGGAGGNGGAGGGGGSACLDPSTYADLFTVKDAGFCVVGLYESDAVVGAPSTWGRHGGPVAVSPAPAPGSVTIERLTPPGGATGKLTITTSDVDTKIPAMTFLGAQAIDLPFFDWTVVSYTASDLTGEIVLLDGTTVAARYPVNGFYAGVGVGDGTLGRLLYTGISPVNDAATKTNALYAADACGTAASMPRLVPDGDMTCAAPLAVDTFGVASGPIAADHAGNVFVIMSEANGDQDARGYAAEKVARGTGPAAGASLFTLPGYAGSLAAIAPGSGDTGVLAFQPVDGTTFDALDVVAQRYRVENGAVVAEGTPGVFLSAATPGASLPFFTDDQDRLWVAGQRGMDTTVLAVVARVP
ncbi:hypothetical protein [Polyangium mundeleinium]|uniref:Uncharacterized protein n=1 Tax=Polyangium mundeleinium TaxID=2995306 RepID=A0ABT5EPI6_9BACT|nr:hypothetical protein [Polyangium mundeleinium]MDC0743731.1 hypothetical protein [Polyangium mundeleinium]